MGGRITIAAALFLYMSGEADPPTVTVAADPTGQVETSAALPPAGDEPAHGGTVVTAGPHQVEVVVTDEGTIDAYAVGGTPALGDAQITVRVPADDDDIHAVMLVWDPSSGGHRGRLRRVRPLPGPIEVVVVTPAGRHRGRAPRFVVLAPSSRPDTVVVEAPPPSRPASAVVVDHPAPPQTVHVRGPEPRVVVAPPSRTVRVRRPEPRIVVAGPPRPHRPHVVVEPPHPGRVVVGGGRHGHRGRARGHRERHHRRRGHGHHDDDDD